MEFGVFMFPTDYSIRPDDLARAVEERGFESLWFPEHTHIPASRRSPWPGGAELPQEYWHSYDPFVALTAAALATARLKVGTGICLVVERDPIITAKEIASLDRLSNGRLFFGIGGGWNAEEMENHGTNFKLRWRILRENILAMKEIWTKDEAEFHGKYVNFDKIWSYPKPVQQPHPPIVIGGMSPAGYRRAIAQGDGWYGFNQDEAAAAESIEGLKRAAADAGTPERFEALEISVTPRGPMTRDRLERFEDLGVSRLILLPGRPGAGDSPLDASRRFIEDSAEALLGG